jgi:NAD(P)-dependent dehydrogenase (short-subunit alcohol dehydrogenase family)
MDIIGENHVRHDVSCRDFQQGRRICAHYQHINNQHINGQGPLLNEGGSIILTGSVAGVKGTPAFGVYGATKAAIRSFVRTWTAELKDRRIRSNVVSPGPTDTPAVVGQPADAIARIVSTIPMGRMGTRMRLPGWRCFWRRMTPASSPVSNCSLMAAERKSDRKPLRMT